MWLQAGVAIVVLDFLQWCIHNLLHRFPILWSFHKLHHGVKDGEMDWIVSFRFQWTEVVVYKAAMVLPLAWMGFSVEALWIQAVVGTAIGHLNHANLPWTYGPLRYVLNNPAMHIWHHDHDGPATNFGVGISVGVGVRIRLLAGRALPTDRLLAIHQAVAIVVQVVIALPRLQPFSGADAGDKKENWQQAHGVYPSFCATAQALDMPTSTSWWAVFHSIEWLPAGAVSIRSI